MKKIIYYLAALSLFCMCKSPKVQFKDPELIQRNEIKQKILTDYEAQKNEYSLIFFTQNYNGDDIKVTNDEKVIFDGQLNSDSSLGLAKTLRVDNNFDVEIKEKISSFKFSLKKNQLKKYKYIYIARIKGNSRYLINYSNEMQAFR